MLRKARTSVPGMASDIIFSTQLMLRFDSSAQGSQPLKSGRVVCQQLECRLRTTGFTGTRATRASLTGTTGTTGSRARQAPGSPQQDHRITGTNGHLIRGALAAHRRCKVFQCMHRAHRRQHRQHTVGRYGQWLQLTGSNTGFFRSPASRSLHTGHARLKSGTALGPSLTRALRAWASCARQARLWDALPDYRFTGALSPRPSRPQRVAESGGQADTAKGAGQLGQGP